jgi:hypothetical protein
MSFFAETTKLVDFGGGNTATVRKLSFGEHMAAQSSAMRMTQDGVQMDYPKLRLELAKAATVAWDGPDFDRPCTPANVEALPLVVGGKLADAAQELLSVGEEAGN